MCLWASCFCNEDLSYVFFLPKINIIGCNVKGNITKENISFCAFCNVQRCGAVSKYKAPLATQLDRRLPHSITNPTSPLIIYKLVKAVLQVRFCVRIRVGKGGNSVKYETTCVGGFLFKRNTSQTRLHCLCCALMWVYVQVHRHRGTQSVDKQPLAWISKVRLHRNTLSVNIDTGTQTRGGL